MKAYKTNSLKTWLKEYCAGIIDSANGFETDVLEIFVWGTYREDIGKLAHLLSEEEREQVARADEIAKKLAQEKKDEEAGIGFKYIVNIIKKYPVYPTSQTKKATFIKKAAQPARG